MKNTKSVNRILQFLSYRSVLHRPEYRKQFFLETGLLNFNRLRVFGYFILAFSFFQLLSDVFLGEFWDTRQVSYFMILDIFLACLALIVLAITHIRPPRDANNIKLWHIYSAYIFILLELLWGSAISIIESDASNSLPTFLIGVFMAATIFILRSLPFLFLLVSSLIVTYTGLYRSGVPMNQIVTIYGPLIFLIITAWIVSIALFNTRLRSFAITKEIEEAKNNLDALVKERTIELSKTNEKLLAEIRERKRYAKSLEEEKLKAQEADRLKSVFLANMSHEIRTPLNGILGFGDLLRNTNPLEEKKARYLDIIANNGQQLLKIIDDIMDISMIESNQLKINQVKFRLNHVLPDAIEFFNSYIRINNKEHLELVNLGFPVTANDTVISDPTRVQQVLYNVISNAVKFTSKGQIRIGGKTDNGFALIYIEDTGIGVDAKKCNTIFERFRQGEESYTRSYGGTGLGLSIAKGIVELLGGMIWVDLYYTQGSRFCFTIPTEAMAANDATPNYESSYRALEKKCIIVTNEKNNYRGYMIQLLKCHNLIIPVLHVSELTMLKPGYAPELIIFDTPMADDTIFQHIYNLSQTYPNSDIIAATGSYDPMIISKYKASGCKLVLTAPVNYHLLLLHVHEMFNAKPEAKNQSQT